MGSWKCMRSTISSPIAIKHSDDMIPHSVNTKLDMDNDCNIVSSCYISASHHKSVVSIKFQ